MSQIMTALSYAPTALAYLLAFSFVAFPFGAMLQERKAFRDVGLGFLGSFKAFLFIQVRERGDEKDGRRHDHKFRL